MRDTAQGIQLSLYDYFGFLFPGTILLAAGTVFAWAVWAPRSPLVRPDFSIEVWVGIAILAYVCGHVVQACSNVLAVVKRGGLLRWRNKENNRVTDRLKGDGVDEALLNQLTASIATDLGVPTTNVNLKLLAKLGDQVDSAGKGRLEMFTYREGFYRGGTIAMFVLTLAWGVRACRKPIEVAGRSATGGVGHITVMPTSAAWLIAALLAIVTYLWFKRYERFAVGADAKAILTLLTAKRLPDLV